MEKRHAAGVQGAGRSWYGWLKEIPGVNSQREGALYLILMLFTTGMVVYCWFVLGPSHPAYALMVAGWTVALGPIVAVPLILGRLPRLLWFRVPPGERVLHLMLGVPIFDWLLERSGWNRYVARPMRRFDGTRAGLRHLEQSARGGASVHGICFLIHALFAALALSTGHPRGALWMLLPGAFVHLYPVLLQRSIILRLQPLLERCGS